MYSLKINNLSEGTIGFDIKIVQLFALLNSCGFLTNFCYLIFIDCHTKLFLHRHQLH